MAYRTHDLYNVHMTTCCKKTGPSPYRLVDLKRNCRIRLFREIIPFDDVQDYDYIFPTSTAVIQCDAPSLRTTLNEQQNTIAALKQQLQKYVCLFKFSQCYNHFGQTVLLPRLKQMNPPTSPIQNCDYWKNCTQYLGSFDDRTHEQNTLQEQIYSIVRQYGIDRPTWNAIFKLNNRRNQEVHTPISHADAIWLKDNSDDYEQFEILHSSRSNFVLAVQRFASVLCSQYPPNQFAQQQETSLNRYRNLAR